MSMRRPARALALVVLLTAAGACTYSRRMPLAAAPAPADSVWLGNGVRVRKADGGTLELDKVSVVRDSVVGWRQEGRYLHRVALARADVRSVEQHGVDGGRTVLLIGGTVLALTVLYAALFALAVSSGDY